MVKNASIYFLLFFLLGCKKELNQEVSIPVETHPNILLIIADDLGKDAIHGFLEGSIKPSTPNIDEIRTSGLSYSNFWVYPTCTPTRASIITGKYGYRTGVKKVQDALNSSETTLQKFIHEKTNNTYATAVIGKWHLAGSNKNFNPETLGIDYYTGFLKGELSDYYNWSLFEDGNFKTQNAYATTVFTDLAINWVSEQNKPWFLWLAYNAPHTPFHTPPGKMHSQGNLPDYDNGVDPLPYYLAAIEAMDFQIGRLLESLSSEEKAKTILLFMGDNGTPAKTAQAPYSRFTSKGSLYQGGINTPLFVSGNGVLQTGTDDRLITSSDLFATIAGIAGIDIKEIHDSKSFKSSFKQALPTRDFQYSELNDDTRDFWAISNGDYKLIVNQNGSNELYHLAQDPNESFNLLTRELSTEALAALDYLNQGLLDIRN